MLGFSSWPSEFKQKSKMCAPRSQQRETVCQVKLTMNSLVPLAFFLTLVWSFEWPQLAFWLEKASAKISAVTSIALHSFISSQLTSLAKVACNRNRFLQDGAVLPDFSFQLPGPLCECVLWDSGLPSSPEKQIQLIRVVRKTRKPVSQPQNAYRDSKEDRPFSNNPDRLTGSNTTLFSKNAK